MSGARRTANKAAALLLRRRMRRKNWTSAARRGFCLRAGLNRSNAFSLLARSSGASRRHCSIVIFSIVMSVPKGTSLAGRLGRCLVAAAAGRVTVSHPSVLPFCAIFGNKTASLCDMAIVDRKQQLF